MKPSRGRRLLFAIAAVGLTTAVAVSALLLIDIRLHAKYQMSAGFNVWGYRGPSVGRKPAGEFRVAVLGGSTAFGYGVTWDRAIPAQLEQRVAQRAPERRVRVINLGYNNEGAYSFTFTLADYAWLRYDAVILYEGYNDHWGDERPNVSVFRHDSPVFRLTGYLPIFPIVFKEKAAAMVSGNGPGSLYSSEPKTVFSAGPATRTSAYALTTVATISQAIERRLGALTAEPSRTIPIDPSTGCRRPWMTYCESMREAVVAAMGRGADVIVATQPYSIDDVREAHIAQQRELRAMMRRLFANDARVQYVNLGDAIDLTDRSLSVDGMHLTARGNSRIAELLCDPIIAAARRRATP